MASEDRVLFTINQRLKILKELKTSSVRDIAKKYNAHRSTIFRIKKNAKTITDFANKGKLDKKRKSMKRPLCEELEERLYGWFIEMRTIGTALSDAMLIEKANELKEEFGVCSNFKASRGWITKFKKRYQIRLVRTHGGKSTVNEDVANSFVQNFEKYIEEEEISFENIYNMDETGLLWKALPLRTPVAEPEKNIGGHNKEDWLTIGFCANASGTHKIAPLVIHEYENTSFIKDCIGQLPVIFKARSNAWMNENLFVDWFENHFKKSVRQHQLENRLCGKVILLLDDCPSHRFPRDYEHDDEFEVKFLPANTVPPMDRGIEKVKRCFRHSLTERLVTSGYGINEFLRKYTIFNCIYLISEAWGALTCGDIKNAWKSILRNTQTVEEAEEDEIIYAMQQAWSHVSGRKVTVEFVENYFTACSEEERRLSDPLRETVAEDVHEGRAAEEVVAEGGRKGTTTKEVVAENGHKERVFVLKEEVILEDGPEGMAVVIKEEDVSEDRREGRSVIANEEVVAEEEKRDIGLKLPPGIRRKLEDAFESIKTCQNYFPRSVNCLLKGIQLSILGDTTSVDNK